MAGNDTGRKPLVVVQRGELAQDQSAPAPDGRTVMVYQRPDGSFVAPDPSPLRKMTPRQRLRFVLGVLELRIVGGDMDAVRAWLQHHRWSAEMRKGRAPVRGTIEHEHSITIHDDLGTAPPKSVGSGKVGVRSLAAKGSAAPQDVVLSPGVEQHTPKKAGVA